MEKTLSRIPNARRKALIGLVFDDRMPWGRDQTRPPTLILYTLSRRRPRWLIELCKVAAHSAAVERRVRINFDNITNELASFGQRRVEDMVAEFRSQCPELEELLAAFVGEPEWFSTDALMTAINNRILQAVHPTIVGTLGRASATDVAHFLYQIGFLTARRDLAGGQYEHLAYADNPMLFAARTNIDQGYSWEIHPVFRQVLRLRNV